MGGFHNNKLNAIGIDDLDDQEYTPARTPTSNRKLRNNASSSAKNMSTPKTPPNPRAGGSSSKQKRKRGSSAATMQHLEDSNGPNGAMHTGSNDIENFSPTSQSLNGGYSAYLQHGASHNTHDSLHMAQVSRNIYHAEDQNNSWAYNQQNSPHTPDNSMADDFAYFQPAKTNLMGQGLFHQNDTLHPAGDGNFGSFDRTPEGCSRTFDDDQAYDLHSDSIAGPASPEGSEYKVEESDEERVAKTSKNNKGGSTPRKPRDPRPPLIKWDDNDWRNAVLGLIYACGEHDLRIPFEEAAQLVASTCTAGALQQAVLKLRDRQIAEGYPIPPLKMSWNKRHNLGTLSTVFGTVIVPATPARPPPKRKQYSAKNPHSHMVVLNRPYRELDRRGLAAPYKFKKGARSGKPARAKKSAASEGELQTTAFHNDDHEDHDDLNADQMPPGVGADIDQSVHGSNAASNDMTPYSAPTPRTPFSTPSVITPFSTPLNTDTGLHSNAANNDLEYNLFTPNAGVNPPFGDKGSPDGTFSAMNTHPKTTFDGFGPILYDDLGAQAGRQPTMAFGGFGPMLHGDLDPFGTGQHRSTSQESSQGQHATFKYLGNTTQGFSGYGGTPSKQVDDINTLISFPGDDGSRSSINNVNGANAINASDDSNGFNASHNFNDFIASHEGPLYVSDHDSAPFDAYARVYGAGCYNHLFPDHNEDGSDSVFKVGENDSSPYGGGLTPADTNGNPYINSANEGCGTYSPEGSRPEALPVPVLRRHPSTPRASTQSVPRRGPSTPPTSTQAEQAVAENLRSQLRENGAFMPQASHTRDYTRHDLDNPFPDGKVPPFDDELFDRFLEDMASGKVTMHNVEDPFLGP